MSDYTDLLSNVRDYTETTSDVLTDAKETKLLSQIGNVTVSTS